MILLIFPLLISFFIGAADTEWTWFYTKFFETEQAALLSSKKAILFSKEQDVPRFNQLIFSWNAMRPDKGYFVFKVCVRNAKTQKWYNWHTMGEWGAEKRQKSFKNAADGTVHHHVRLELPRGCAADGIRIQIESHDQAPLENIKAIHVSVSNWSLFEKEDPKIYNSFKTRVVKGVPIMSQMTLDHPKKEVLCSPTSCAMLLSYLLKKPVPPTFFADCAYDNGLAAYGSWPFNIAHAFEVAGDHYYFAVRRLGFFKQLYAFLERNIPVVVSVRGYITGAPQSYPHGHLLVVVGWDQKTKKVICHDPAFPQEDQVYVAYDIKSFLSAWERSHRLAYCAYRKTT